MAAFSAERKEAVRPTIGICATNPSNALKVVPACLEMAPDFLKPFKLKHAIFLRQPMIVLITEVAEVKIDNLVKLSALLFGSGTKSRRSPTCYCDWKAGPFRI